MRYSDLYHPCHIKRKYIPWSNADIEPTSKMNKNMLLNIFLNVTRLLKIIINNICLQAAVTAQRKKKRSSPSRTRAASAAGRHIHSDRYIPFQLHSTPSWVSWVRFGLQGDHSEHILAFNPSINPISAVEAAADDSLIQADTGREIHKGREAFQQHPPHCTQRG